MVPFVRRQTIPSSQVKRNTTLRCPTPLCHQAPASLSCLQYSLLVPGPISWSSPRSADLAHSPFFKETWFERYFVVIILLLLRRREAASPARTPVPVRLDSTDFGVPLCVQDGHSSGKDSYGRVQCSRRCLGHVPVLTFSLMHHKSGQWPRKRRA